MNLQKLARRARRRLRTLADGTGAPARVVRRILAETIGQPADSHHVLIAPPGAGNIGDQAMVEAFVAAADRPVTVITRSAADFDRTDLSPATRIVPLPALLYGDGHEHVHDVRALGRHLEGAATVSIIGADIMDGVYSLRPSLRRSAIAAQAAAAGFDTSVIGFSWNGAAPRASWAALREAGAAGARLLLRDPASAARVRDAGIAGVVDTADIVFTDARLADELPVELVGLPQPYAVMNASGLVARSVDQAGEYAAVIGMLRGRGIHVVLVPHVLRASADDVEACRAVVAAAGPSGVTLVEQALTPSQIRRLTDSAVITITGRMHLAVMSLSRGVPAVTLATQGKVEGLMQLFEWPQLCVTPAAGLSGHIIDIVIETLDGRDARSRVQRGADRARALARANVERITGRGTTAIPRGTSAHTGGNSGEEVG